MGRYQKSKPSKKVRTKLEQKRLARLINWEQRHQHIQEETIETLALGVESLVGSLEEKEKEYDEVVNHEIELSEDIMMLGDQVENLQKDLERDRKWHSHLRAHDDRADRNFVRENEELRERLRATQSGVNRRDMMLSNQGQENEELRNLVRAQAATIRRLQGGGRGGLRGR